MYLKFWHYFYKYYCPDSISTCMKPQTTVKSNSALKNRKKNMNSVTLKQGQKYFCKLTYKTKKSLKSFELIVMDKEKEFWDVLN